ncbi:hypothetical protein JCM8097_003531 [Rhodosporidiobolus ruineniae]
MSTPVAKHQGLYAFQLPVDTLSLLRPRTLVIPDTHALHPSNRTQTLSEQPPHPAETDADAAHQAGAKGDGAYKCALTGASFDSLAELRDHYRTDWYRYNVKLKLKGLKTPVGEDEFNRRVQDLSDSLSGSDSASDSDASASSSSSSNSTSHLSRLLRQQSSLASPSTGTAGTDDSEDPFAPLAGPRTALLWFDTPTKEGEQPSQYGVYRAALPRVGAEKRSSEREGEEALAELKELQLASTPGGDEEKERKWTLLMFGGGHFAGMVVSLKPRLVSKGKGKEKDREVVVLQRKTFHRYTTRRKQGGGQSAHDAAGGKAKSMGAQLRRHNEMALTDEVRELLSSWSDDIASSELVFLRCSKNNYKTFFGYDGAVLERGDPRIRGYTFPTRRPTLSELLRAFLELTRVKTTHLDASALAALDADYLASITPRTAPAPAAAPPAKEKKEKDDKPRLTKEQELERDRWTRLVDMVRKGRLDALAAFLDKYGPELESGSDLPWGALPEWMRAEQPEVARTPTLLHVASAADQPAVVRYLLRTKRADPTVSSLPSPSSSSPSSSSAGDDPTRPTPTAYDLAPSRLVRNEFRFLLHAEPGLWDWPKAKVPSGLDEAKEKEREAKEQQKRDALRQKQAEREKKEAEERAAAEAAAAAKAQKERDDAAAARSLAGRAGPQRLGGAGGAAVAAVRERGRDGLSEEQRARVMREERARAAEERFKRMQGGQ